MTQRAGSLRTRSSCLPKTIVAPQRLQKRPCGISASDCNDAHQARESITLALKHRRAENDFRYWPIAIVRCDPEKPETAAAFGSVLKSKRAASDPRSAAVRRFSRLPSLADFDLTTPCRTGPRMGGPPNFAEREERACARPFIVDARQNRFPRAPLFAAPAASLIRPDPAWRAPPILETEGEGR
jgi:hypothetical protein